MFAQLIGDRLWGVRGRWNRPRSSRSARSAPIIFAITSETTEPDRATLLPFTGAILRPVLPRSHRIFPMPIAVGTIETLGFPSILAAADAMVKGARVTLVSFDKAEKGNFFIAIRGPVSEVERAMEAGIKAAKEVYGGQVMGHYIIAHPYENVEGVMPIDYTAESDPHRVT